MRKSVPVVRAAVCIAAQAVTSSQSAAPPRAATDVTSADLQAMTTLAPADGISDQQTRVARRQPLFAADLLRNNG